MIGCKKHGECSEVAASGTVAYARMRRVDSPARLLFAATVPGAVLGAYATGFRSRQLFDLIA
jgi:uncharacterized membrane protein YfcA